MPLSSEIKEDVIKDFKMHDTDTGSCNVQIALLTSRINQLTDHFKTHKKDHHSRRGLLVLVNRRAKLLKYLKGHDLESYREVISKLGIRDKR